MPTRPPKELLELLHSYDRGVQELALELRDVVIEEMAPCREGIYEVYIISLVYTSAQAKRGICYIGVIKDHVNLGFHYGARLSDPHRLLEGDGKQMRHIKIRNMKDVLNPALQGYIREACEQAGHDPAPGEERMVSTMVKRKGAPARSLGAKKL